MQHQAATSHAQHHAPRREHQESLAADSLLEDLRLSRVREWGTPAQQLIQETAQRPVIHGFVVSTRQH